MCNTLSVAVLLMVALSLSVQAQSPINNMARLAELARALDNLAKCRASTGATEEDVRQMIETRKVPESRAAQCLIACMGHAYGVVENGRFSPDAAMRLVDDTMRRHNREDPQLRAEIQYAVATCSATEVSQDECVAAAQLSDCGLQQVQRIIPLVMQRRNERNQG